MGIPSPFEVKAEQREQHLKERSGTDRPEPQAKLRQPGKKESIKDQLPTARKKGKAYNLYIDREVMERVTALSATRGVSVSSMASALLKIALEQMEG